jgi:hypothetical protein
MGGAVYAALAVINQIACIGMFTCLIGLLGYAAIGALAAYWMPPGRDLTSAGIHGALAGGLAALIGGVVSMILSVFQAAVFGLAQASTQLLREFQDRGYDAGPFVGTGVGGAICGGTFCGGISVIYALALGAIGGVALASVMRD